MIDAMVGIRLLGAQDFDAFCGLLDAFLQHAGDDQGLTVLQKRELFAKAVDPDHNYFVLGAFADDESDELIGILSLSFVESSYRCALFGWCDDMFVQPDRRGQGVGKRLVERAAAFASDRGCSNILLGVGNNDHKAQQFYMDCGFIDLNNRLYSLVL